MRSIVSSSVPSALKQASTSRLCSRIQACRHIQLPPCLYTVSQVGTIDRRSSIFHCRYASTASSQQDVSRDQVETRTRTRIQPPTTTLAPSSQSAIKKPPIPVVSSCPAPNCACSSMPELPENLPIDTTTPLNNTAPTYDQYILFSTGKSDWTSKIELDVSFEKSGRKNPATVLKGVLGRGGRCFDPQRSVAVGFSSFGATGNEQKNKEEFEAYLFPSFQYVRGFVPSEDGAVEFVEKHILPTFTPLVEGGGEKHSETGPKDIKDSRKTIQGLSTNVSKPITSTTVLICSHGGRDMRCGILGPLLKDEFERVFTQPDIRCLIDVSSEPYEAHRDGEKKAGSREDDTKVGVSVGLVSHVGGHKWAGNVIVYVSPYARTLEAGVEKASPLAGRGVWYGRVEPKHVDGIVRETILGGKVIEELLRGVV
jgi:hypothetical protein